MQKLKSRIFTLRNVIFVLVIAVLIFGLIKSSTYNYLLFHTTVELTTILIGFSVFIFAWNSRKLYDSNFLTVVGISFLFISSIDLIHSLAYTGMNIFQGFDSNLPAQLWIAARYLQSITFLLALIFLHRKTKPYLLLLGYFLVTVVIVVSIFLSIFPDCYIEGSGFTDFNIVSEYIISLIFIIATVLLFVKRKEFGRKVFIWIVTSLVLLICGEITFAFYISLYGLSNLIGHIFKLLSYYFLYLSIIEIGIKKPYELLFRKLDQNIIKLGEANKELSNNVVQAEEEIIKRKSAEEKIKTSQIRFYELFNHISSGVAVLEAVEDGLDFVFVDINTAGQQMDHISREEVIGHKVTEIFPEIEEINLLDVFRIVWKDGKAKHHPTKEYKDNHLMYWRENFVYKLSTGEIVVVYDDITHRKKDEERIRGNNKRLLALSEILNHEAEDIQVFLDYALEQALLLTESKLGYFYFYDEEKQEFTLNTWSREAMEACSVPDPQTIYQLEKTGIWGEAVRQRKPIVINNFQKSNPLKKGYPEGHAHLKNFLTIPIINHDKITAVVGVANKSGNYDDSDILQLTLLMGTVWKIVYQRQTDEALLISEKKFHTLAQSASDAIITINSEGIIIFWNGAAKSIFGFSEKEMIGNSLGEIVPRGFQQAHKENINRVVSTGKSKLIGKIVELEGTKKDGQKIPIELSLAITKVDKETFITAIIRDITDRKMMDQKIRLDSLILTSISDGILLYKVSDETIVYTNPQFEALFGYDAGELNGQNVSILNASTEMDSRERAKEIREALLENSTWEGEIRNVRKDGSIFWSHASITVFLHPDFGEVWVSVQQDFSHQKEVERDLTVLSTHDALTGLYNRTFFDEEMARFNLSREYPISVIMADIDGLKIINDTKGHMNGDLLLKRAANVLVKSFRGDDIIARIGGDEFAILLPQADMKTANQALKRIKRNVLENNKKNTEFQLDISCGASTAKLGQDLGDVLKQADAKMYIEKNKKNPR